MEIRRAERTDSRKIAELWTHTFPGSGSIDDRAHQLETGGVFGGLDTAFVAREGDTLVGALRAYRMKQFIGGAALPMMGLASVAVSPAARRRGIAHRLCAHVLRSARERGDVVSALYPFRPAFYASLGWGLVGELHRYRFPPESLSVTEDTIPVRLAREADEAAVIACYERVARNANGLIERNAKVWRQNFDASDSHVFVLDEAEPRGYVLVRYGRARSADRRPLHVRELIATEPAAYDALLAWLSRQRDLWRRITYDATPDEHFALRLTDPRPPGYRGARRLWATVARVIRGPMLRILHVPAAIEKRRRWGAARAHALTLELHDAELPENAGPHAIEFDGTRATVRSGRANGAVVRTTAATFAQLYAGEIDLVAAQRLGLVEVEGDASASAAMLKPDSSFRLLDVF